MQTRQWFLTHNQTKGSYPFSHMSKEQQIGLAIIQKDRINPKNHRPLPSSAGVYKIPCSCEQIYIRETERMVKLRIKEHQRDVRLKHVTQSALSERNRTSNTV